MKVKKAKDPLAGKRDPVSQLYRAVRRYVESNDGSVIVIGGASLIEMPGDLKMNYTIGVRCTGRRPQFKPAGTDK